jgi:uncharacterized protein (DUF488 family)
MSSAKHHLYTLGYEGLELDSFIRVLENSGIETVVDVRQLPLSRKKGFSKTALCQALAGRGIAYLHAPQLGCPKAIRQQYQEDGDWGAYTKGFLEYLKTQAGPVRELVKLARATAACLVCFEADFSLCHRTYVARQAHLMGAPFVVHLTARTSFPDLSRQAA